MTVKTILRLFLAPAILFAGTAFAQAEDPAAGASGASPPAGPASSPRASTS